MTAKKKNRKPSPVEKKRPSPRSKTSRIVWIGGVIAVAAIGALIVLRSPSTPDSPSGPNASSTSNTPTASELSSKPDNVAGKATDTGDVEFERLAGRWLRPDGGYVLEIRDVESSGRLEAAYYNPRSINVSRAEWRVEDRLLRVFVELNDVNYPGSTYTLFYFPEQDRLAGNYFQAVHKQTFEVFFVRQE
jgi:hypothetical protein